MRLGEAHPQRSNNDGAASDGCQDLAYAAGRSRFWLCA